MAFIGDVNLLIAAPMLQDYFVDNATGGAMSGGIVTAYQNNSSNTLKDWYYQAGVYGGYTYLELDNPLTLSAVGTITDSNGNDVIPFFYPYNIMNSNIPEPYHFNVVNSNGQNQFDRYNFPFNTNQSTPLITGEPDLNNILINNVFWRNLGNHTIAGSNPITTSLNTLLAPGAHDGFIGSEVVDSNVVTFYNGDIRFVKDQATSTDTIEYKPFNQIPLMGDVTPENYVQVSCTIAGSGETLKAIQIPISLHLATLDGQTATFSIWTRNISGAVAMQIKILQYNGSDSLTPYTYYPAGASSSFNTTLNAWTKTTGSFTFNPIGSISQGTVGDDAYYLIINFPLNTQFSIDIALPRIYLGNVTANPPNTTFETYDIIDSLINDARTGDVRISLNDFYPMGWVPLNNGLIGKTGALATSRANIDTWPLYNLIWNKFSIFNTVNTSIIGQMFNPSNAQIAYTNALTDFNAGNVLLLSQLMGKVILGTVPVSALLAPYTVAYSTIIASNAIGATGASSSFFNGMPFYLTSVPVGLTNPVINKIYYVTNLNILGANDFQLSTSFAQAMTGTANVTFSSSDPDGNGNIIAIPAGSFEGEYGHVQLPSEVGTHTHPVPIATYPPVTGGADPTKISEAASGTGASGVANATSNNNLPAQSQASNVIQPGSFMNMFMKL